MSLFEGTAPPNVTTTDTTKVTAPQYLTDYLTDLAKTGQTQLGTPSDQLIAPLTQNLTTLYAPGTATTALTRYQPAMDAALTAGTAGGQAVTSDDISAFYNPYEADVVNRMGQLSAQNVQRSMLPALRAAFAGTGGFGSQRYAGALGQAMSDVQTGLLGEQAKLKAQGFKDAVDAALRQKGYQTQAASALGNIGTAEQQAATTGLKTLGDIGTQELAYEQSQIEAPLTRAQNVAKILQGYQFPTTTEKTYVGPASTYAPSPLTQIAGLGSLVGSLFGQTINPKTGEVMQTGPGWSALKGIFGSSDSSGISADLQAALNNAGVGGLGYGEAGSEAATGTDSEGNPII